MISSVKLGTVSSSSSFYIQTTWPPSHDQISNQDFFVFLLAIFTMRVLTGWSKWPNQNLKSYSKSNTQEQINTEKQGKLPSQNCFFYSNYEELSPRPSLQIQASKSKCPSPSLQVSGWELQWFFHVDLLLPGTMILILWTLIQNTFVSITHASYIICERGNNVWREIWDWKKITFLWVIDFIWLKELCLYALYANKFRDLKASNGLAHTYIFSSIVLRRQGLCKKMDDEIFQVLATRVHVYMH